MDYLRFDQALVTAGPQQAQRGGTVDDGVDREAAEMKPPGSAPSAPPLPGDTDPNRGDPRRPGPLNLGVFGGRVVAATNSEPLTTGPATTHQRP